MTNMDRNYRIDIDYYTRLRHELHRFPELGYREHRTGERVCRELERLGIDYERGVGTTGIVAVIRKGNSPRSIALRADLDALPIPDESGVPYASEVPGISHACGHDGHTVMLLAAAEALTKEVEFDGTVTLVFQPAEEGGAGARAMIEDGLFERFPIDRIYGLHNRPQEPFGTFLIKEGPVMTAVDTWSVEVTGRSGHSSQPHRAVNPIIVAAHIVQAIKEISSLAIDPAQAHVITVAKIESGTAFNVIPDRCRIEGSVRSFDPEVSRRIEERIATLSERIADAFGARAAVEYRPVYPATINSVVAPPLCAARRASKGGVILTEFPSSMGSEDFSFFLEKVPGCYVWLGSGRQGSQSVSLHSSRYDFDDDLIPVGASYWVELVRAELGDLSCTQK